MGLYLKHHVRPFRLAAALLAVGLSAGSALGAQPAALVEDITGKADVALMDLLIAGQTVRLDAGTTITLGYLRSCTEEVITAGVVTIGNEQSTITGGKVERRQVECDGGRMLLTPQQAAVSGVAAFREAPVGENWDADQVLHGTRPLLRAGKPGKVRIQRLDRPAPAVNIEIPAAKTPFYDFVQHDQTLAAGGRYRATGPSGETVFRIVPEAPRDGVAPLSRLLSL